MPALLFQRLVHFSKFNFPVSCTDLLTSLHTVYIDMQVNINIERKKHLHKTNNLH